MACPKFPSCPPSLALQSQGWKGDLAWEAPFSLDLATMFCEQNCMHAEALPLALRGQRGGGGGKKRKGPQGPQGKGRRNIFLWFQGL